MSENINELLETKNDSNQKLSKGGFFSFQKMISLTLIKIIYVIGMIAVTVFGIGLMTVGGGAYGHAEYIFGGMAIIIFGNLFWRIFCEGWIIIFSLHETTVSILNELKDK